MGFVSYKMITKKLFITYMDLFHIYSISQIQSNRQRYQDSYKKVFPHITLQTTAARMTGAPLPTAPQ